MESAGIVEKKLSEWGLPVCIVAKADGSPRFSVNCRTTINKFLVRETWPMPDIESHIDTVSGANFITVCDVQSAYWQITIAKKHGHKTGFVTSKCKYVFKVLPFGIAKAPWIFQRFMSLAFANFGQPSGLLVYMDDAIACSATWEAYLRLLEDMFRALQTALYLGTINFIHEFVPNLAPIIRPLGALTRESVANLIGLRNHWGVFQRLGGGDTTSPSPGRSPKQPVPRIGLHDPLYGWQACT